MTYSTHWNNLTWLWLLCY